MTNKAALRRLNLREQPRNQKKTKRNWDADVLAPKIRAMKTNKKNEEQL